MNAKVTMQFPYGAVYFRKSNPPRQDWERDYAVAQEDGLNLFRHWFMWGAIETKPGVYDWADYDRQMELAQRHGQKVVIAEFMDAVPEWLYHDHPELFFRHADGSLAQNQLGVSCPAGGFGAGPCLDNPEARERAGAFLRALAAHYKGHPALLGYDMWNETNFPPDVCYCQHTKRAFREWLKRKYGSLEALGQAWCRYSYTSWEQVEPPQTLDFYMESLDWLLFRKENVYNQLQWRVDQIRSVDQDCLIAAHGTAASIDRQALSCYDDWDAAEKVELYGLTYVPCRHTGAPWRLWGAVDLTRCAARGKTIWHAEMQGGPLWLQPQALGRPKTDGRIPDERDVRLYNLSSMACGSRGVLYPRMRPILNGPLFGAFGPYGMDGSRTKRSQMASSLAKWANHPDTAPLWEALPVRGQVGILLTAEAQMGSYLLSLHGGCHAFSDSAWGAYTAFFDSNIQADFVKLEDLDSYRMVYLPYSPLMTQKQADALIRWVEKGGTLVSEACPGYFDGLAVACARQPGLGLETLFGAQEQEVEWTPDLLDGLAFSYGNHRAQGGVTLQSYAPTTGMACGWFDDGRVAVVTHGYGKGKALLIGTHPSVAYRRAPTQENRKFFESLLALSGQVALVSVDDPRVKARLHVSGEQKSYLWVVNTSDEMVKAQVTLHEGGAVGVNRYFWNEGEVKWLEKNRFSVSVPGKDAIVFELKQTK